MAEATSTVNAELVSDAAVLAEFLRTPYYAVLRKYYDLMIEDKRNRVLTATRDTFEYWQGVYLGSRDVIELPESVLAEAKRREDAEQDR